MASPNLHVDDCGEGNRVEAAKDSTAHIEIRGNRNSVRLGPRSAIQDQARLIIEGDDNSIELGGRTKLVLDSLVWLQGNANKVRFGKRCGGRICLHLEGASSVFEMGDDTTFVGVQIEMREPSCLTIGRDCMFSAQVWVMTSDMHSVIDLDSGTRINPAADVAIGDTPLGVL